MKAKITAGVVLFALLTLFLAQPVSAQEKLAGMSANTFKPSEEELKVDNRAKALKAYLQQYNSPLADSADTFVTSADAHNIDWKFVAAIAGLESGFGKHIPANSYNAWGWGVYGDNVHRFASWDEGIETISKGLRERYMDKWGATDVYTIGKYYASSPTWAIRVENFMNKIDAFYQQYESQTTPDTLRLSI
jgi:hypothetical protein